MLTITPAPGGRFVLTHIDYGSQITVSCDYAQADDLKQFIEQAIDDESVDCEDCDCDCDGDYGIDDQVDAAKIEALNDAIAAIRDLPDQFTKQQAIEALEKLL